MKYLLFLAALAGILAPSADAAEGARRFRWFPKFKKPGDMPLPVAKEDGPAPIVVDLGKPLLRAEEEAVRSGAQSVGSAQIDGTWTQTVFGPDGQVRFAAGAVFENLPEDKWLARVKWMQANSREAVAAAERAVEGYRHAGRKFPPEVRLRKRGEFEAYWRLEYVPEEGDRVLYLCLDEQGKLLETGEVGVAGADGKAFVFPEGPKWGPLREVSLRQLNGDGTLTNRFFRITSALNLDVRSPNLLFFFPETDRRFDLAQVYYTMDRSFQWMRDFLGVELKDPLEVRLHVGENGVSTTGT
jgi:hypothetical protein